MREQQDKDQPYLTDQIFDELDHKTPEQIADLIARIPGMGFLVKLWRYHRSVKEDDTQPS